jgi:hypothetical protein
MARAIRSMRRWRSLRTFLPQSSAIATTSGRSASLLDVQRGLNSAIATHLIPADSPVIPKVQDFLARVRNGATPQAAADAAGISLAVVSRLAEMGLPAIAQPVDPANGCTAGGC